MNGLWAYYPGSGYSWVSAYPWGWMPYHYGSWMFIPSYGWMWQPGGAWIGLNYMPVAVNPPAGFSIPRPPVRPVNTLLVVNRGPASFAAPTASGKMLVRNGSAGLGVPRGSTGDMRRVSNQAQQHGFATPCSSIRPTSTMMVRPPRPTASPSYYPQNGGFPRPVRVRAHRFTVLAFLFRRLLCHLVRGILPCRAVVRASSDLHSS